jgi:hypothetical protein
MKNIQVSSFAILFCVLSILCSTVPAGDRMFEEIQRFTIVEARQGIAVDRDFIYVIDSQKIGKYSKTTGELILSWEDKDGQIIHLDSGVIVKGKLYCAHSNYPYLPMTSSIEIWDAQTLEHQESHSFGIWWGSCTWLDRFNGFWWATFAHYDKWKPVTGKGTEWTTIIQMDDQWRRLQAWVFPGDVLDKFSPMSNSGGSWGPDSLLYCTGHDLPEVYAFRLPRMGSVLELVDILPVNILGQGIAWDRTQKNILFGIRREDNQVTVSRLVEKK